MAKHENSKSTRDGPRKNMTAKKKKIEKLINQEKFPKPLVNLNHQVPQSAFRKPILRQPHQRFPTPVRTRVQPKPVVPGLSELDSSQYLIRDQRCQEKPEVPLVRLPYEPSITRAIRFEPQGHFPFLKLPGELRNKIYEYVITREHYAIEWVNHNHKTKSLTYHLPRRSGAQGPKLPPTAAERRRSLDFHRRRVSNKHLPEDCLRAGPAALLMVCKSMSEEAASVFYSKSMFYFHGLGALRYFLDHLRPVTTASIEKLSLTYRAYGNPMKTKDVPWKLKSDRLWEQLCWRVTDDCSLKSLNLDITLNRSPVSFEVFDDIDPKNISTEWIKPLWAFKDAGIQRCWGRLQCLSKETAVLEVESWKMRKEILGNFWDEDAEAYRDAYGWEKGKKVTKSVTPKGMVMRLGADGRAEIS